MWKGALESQHRAVRRGTTPSYWNALHTLYGLLVERFDLVVSNTHIFAEICVCDHYLFRLVWVYIIVYWVWVEMVIRTQNCYTNQLSYIWPLNTPASGINWARLVCMTGTKHCFPDRAVLPSADLLKLCFKDKWDELSVFITKIMLTKRKRLKILAYPWNAVVVVSWFGPVWPHLGLTTCHHWWSECFLKEKVRASNHQINQKG